jgi:hypothetical protein
MRMVCVSVCRAKVIRFDLGSINLFQIIFNHSAVNNVT